MTDGGTQDKESDKQVLTTNQIDIDQLFVSSSYIYINYYLLNNNIIHNNEWLTTINHLSLKEHLPNWIQILFKPDYLKIIYYLLENKFCHTKGLVKIFNENPNTCSYRLNKLTNYNIVEIVKDKKKYENVLYKHRKAFRIDDWHFEKAEWYKLSDLAVAFYGKLDFTLSLNPIVINQIKHWKESLLKKTKEVEQDIKHRNKNLDDLLSKYRHVRERKDFNLNEWAKDKIKRGYISNISPDKLIAELENRFKLC